MAHHIRHLQAHEGEQLDTVDSTATVKVRADDTDGEYELFEINAPEGPGAPPHRHPWAEAYYLLDGTLEVTVGARQFRLAPGGSITVPPNAVHSMTAIGGPVTFLAFSMTAGTGQLFADLDRSVPRDRPIEEIVPVLVEVAERNQVTFAR